jgi:hypothetical protein
LFFIYIGSDGIRSIVAEINIEMALKGIKKCKMNQTKENMARPNNHIEVRRYFGDLTKMRSIKKPRISKNIKMSIVKRISNGDNGLKYSSRDSIGLLFYSYY